MTSGSGWQGTLKVALAAFAVTVLVFGPAAALQRREWTRPAVVVLGSGSALSVLILAGEARILLADGDDPVAFGNALSSVQPWSARRIDAVVNVGTDANRRVAQSLVGNPHVRAVWSLVSPGPTTTGDPLAEVPAISRTQQLQLPSGVGVTLEPWSSVPDPKRTDVWRVTVSRGSNRVVVLSDGAAAAAFPAERAAALVVAGASPLAAVSAVSPSGLVAASVAVDGDELRAEPDQPLAWARRVFPGETATITLGDQGVVPPREGLLVPEGTPAATPPAATPLP